MSDLSHHENNPWAKENEQSSSKGKKSDINTMKWTPGDHNIRICPSKSGSGLPFNKYVVHWVPVRTGKNDRAIVHAVDFKCPVCEYVSQIWSEIYRLKEEEELTDKSPEVKKLMAQASKLKGKKTYDMNIIDRDDCVDEKDKSKIKIKRLVAGPTIWKPIIELGASTKWGNPSSSGKRGYDLTITVDGEGLKREYTVLPDPDRKALTEEEMDALKEYGYDLEKLRPFTDVREMFDIIRNAKAPLDNIDLKRVKEDLEILFGEKIVVSPSRKSKDDDDIPEPDDEDDEDTAFSDEPKKSKKSESARSKRNTEEDDEDEEVPAKKSKAKIEEDDDVPVKKSKSKAKVEDDEDEVPVKKSKPKVEEEDEDVEPEKSNDEDIKLEDMDCKGTYDPEDVGCQECSVSGECKILKKSFKVKAEEHDLDLSDYNSGSEIAAAIEKKELAKKVGKSGKSGKVQSAPEENDDEEESAPPAKKRKLPF